MPVNGLAGEKSPYLLQHASNPVDWMPWGDEAFERARSEDLPIFLSIGYATCHWCHVMERESFEDPVVASFLNDGFVSIKVDREERPDIDSVYMTVCQLMTGHGGWPLTVVMTPNKKPFFSGTYFPRETAHGRIGLLELLPKLMDLWIERRSDVEASSEAAICAVQEAEARIFSVGAGTGTDLNVRILERGFEELQSRFDQTQGGFGRAPKFPMPHQLLFLMRWHHLTGDPKALEMVDVTLAAMRRGGIFDQVGFGFHRYSTDERWLVPHFEKMLYDQALLAMSYVEMWQISANEECRFVAEEIFGYVLRELTDAEGAFYSAEDADSEGREGAFYVWLEAEIDEVLTGTFDDETVSLVKQVFQVQKSGNFADESTGNRNGENILHLGESIHGIASALGCDEAQLRRTLETARAELFDSRSTRARPLLDDKILTDWNGLMIAALAIGGRVLDAPVYREAAARAALFLLDKLRDKNGRLLHRYREGEAALAGGAADHAYFVWGLIELYAATFDPQWLEAASTLMEALIDDFWDPNGTGVFNAASDQNDVPVRQKDVYDGAMPSANAVTWYVLLRLGRLTGNRELLNRAAEMGQILAGPIDRNPSAHTMSLVALDLALGPTHEVVVVGDARSEDTRALLNALQTEYRPRLATLFKEVGDEAGDRLGDLAPFSAGHSLIDGRAAAYVCSDFACQRPTQDSSEMLALLG